MSPQDDEERARGGVRREYSLAFQVTSENWSRFRCLSSNTQRQGFPVRDLILTIEALIAPKPLSPKFEFSDDRVLFGRGDGLG
jgi:hypothetical protein